MMNNSEVIITLCSGLAPEGCEPLEPSEWSSLALRLLSAKLQPADISDFSMADFRRYLFLEQNEAERIIRLFGRYDALKAQLKRLAGTGIRIVTRANREYPAALKAKLKNSSPPLFYYAGDISILSERLIGYVGSRELSENDKRFAAKAVGKTSRFGFGAVSGGARGADSVAVGTALECGCRCAEYVPDTLARRIRRPQTADAIQKGKLVILSEALPEDEFLASAALRRNRYIYAQSAAAVVVRSDYNKGGTWSGASYALRKELCPVLCQENKDYPGNTALIQRGALPINDGWDGDVDSLLKKAGRDNIQLSLF